VGASTGITPDLSDPARLITSFAMFVGRLGPLTLVLALAARAHPIPYRPAVETVRIGEAQHPIRMGGNMAGEEVVVIGLGRFGSSVARELERLGHQVLAIDRSEQQVNDIASDVTHALQLDAAEEDALRSAGVADFNAAIVAISSDAEPSIFATMVLKRLGVRNVIAKAGSVLHGEILARVGADRVVFPERETGLRLAHSFNVPNVIDYLDVAPSFGIEKIRPPKSFIGKSLGDLDLKGRMSLTPIALRRGKQVFVNPARDERIAEGDELILIGQDQNLDQLRG